MSIEHLVIIIKDIVRVKDWAYYGLKKFCSSRIIWVDIELFVEMLVAGLLGRLWLLWRREDSPETIFSAVVYFAGWGLANLLRLLDSFFAEACLYWLWDYNFVVLFQVSSCLRHSPSQNWLDGCDSWSRNSMGRDMPMEKSYWFHGLDRAGAKLVSW